MGLYDSQVMDGGSIDRGGTGALGAAAAGDQAQDRRRHAKRDCRAVFLGPAKIRAKPKIAFRDYPGARPGVPKQPAVPCLAEIVRRRLRTRLIARGFTPVTNIGNRSPLPSKSAAPDSVWPHSAIPPWGMAEPSRGMSGLGLEALKLLPVRALEDNTRLKAETVEPRGSRA